MAFIGALPVLGVALGVYAATGICTQWYGCVDINETGKHILFHITLAFAAIVSSGGIFFLISLPVAMCFPKLSLGLCTKRDLPILKCLEKYAIKMLEYSKAEQEKCQNEKPK